MKYETNRVTVQPFKTASDMRLDDAAYDKWNGEICWSATTADGVDNGKPASAWLRRTWIASSNRSSIPPRYTSLSSKCIYIHNFSRAFSVRVKQLVHCMCVVVYRHLFHNMAHGWYRIRGHLSVRSSQQLVHYVPAKQLWQKLNVQATTDTV